MTCSLLVPSYLSCCRLRSLNTARAFAFSRANMNLANITIQRWSDCTDCITLKCHFWEMYSSVLFTHVVTACQAELLVTNLSFLSLSLSLALWPLPVPSKSNLWPSHVCVTICLWPTSRQRSVCCIYSKIFTRRHWSILVVTDRWWKVNTWCRWRWDKFVYRDLTQWPIRAPTSTCSLAPGQAKLRTTTESCERVSLYIYI